MARSHAHAGCGRMQTEHWHRAFRPGNVAGIGTASSEVVLDFEHPPKVRALQDKLQRFYDEHIRPNERVYEAEVSENRQRREPFAPVALIERLKPKARAAGLWNL